MESALALYGRARTSQPSCSSISAGCTCVDATSMSGMNTGMRPPRRGRSSQRALQLGKRQRAEKQPLSRASKSACSPHLGQVFSSLIQAVRDVQEQRELVELNENALRRTAFRRRLREPSELRQSTPCNLSQQARVRAANAFDCPPAIPDDEHRLATCRLFDSDLGLGLQARRKQLIVGTTQVCAGDAAMDHVADVHAVPLCKSKRMTRWS